MKTCEECEQEKPETKEFFSMNGSGKTFRKKCRECSAAATRKWRVDKPDLAKAQDDRRREQHPQFWLESYQKNKEQRLAYAEWYRENNRDKVKQASERWNRANPDKVRERNMRRRARKANADGHFTMKQFRMLCNFYENKCLKCEATDVPLQADHVIPLSIGGADYIENIQPLCGSCNYRKFTKIIDYRTSLPPWFAPILDTNS